MSRRFKFLSTFIVLFSLACALPFCAGGSSGRTAKLSELQNQVDARNKAEDEWATASDGQVIGVGGGIKTEGDSRVKVETSDGSLIRIGADTVFELVELSVVENDPVIRLKVEAGKIWIAVTKSLGQGSFEVETPIGVATVRGSLMSVEQVTGGRVSVTCLEGACGLSNSAGEADLTPGQQTEITASGQAPAAARPMDRNQLEEWLLNVPEAQTAAQQLAADVPLSDTDKAKYPELAFDGQGTLHLLWESTALRPGGDTLHQQKPAGGLWSGATNLTDAFEIIFTNDHNLLAGADGAICAFWSGATISADPGTIGLYRRCQTAAGWLAAEKTFEASGTARDHSLALAPDGSLREVHIASAGDVMFGETKLSDEELATTPALAIDAAGGYHVAWSRLGDPFSVEYRYSSDGGQTWQDATRLSTDEIFADGLGLSLAADAVGNVHLVWSGADANFANGIFYRHWTPAGGWGEVRRLAASEESGPNPDLAVDTESRARVVWSRFDGVRYTAQAADGTWTQPVKLSESESGWPQIAVDVQGVSHVVWVSGEKIFYVTTP